MLIIGITGHPSSGKDTVANYLEKKGFFHVSTGDIFREEMRRKGIQANRANMRVFSSEVLEQRGVGYLGEEVIKKIAGDSVVSGIRLTASVSFLKKVYGKKFILLAIEAPLETRYRRALARDRAGDSISFEQFRGEEDAERKGDLGAPEVDNVIAMADYVVQNDGTKKDLFEKVDALLRVLGFGK